MSRKVRPEDLSENELRRLMMEKKRKSREKRLDAFRRSGRLVEIAPLPEHKTSTLLEDFIIDEPTQPASETEIKEEKRKRVFDRLLFLVEIAAIAGLVFVLFNGMNILQELNQQVAEALVQPSLTPTPLVQAVVLPSGHTSPNSEGGARFNESEIPAHLMPLYQSFANAPAPPRRPEQAIQIVIPAIGVDAPIVAGDGWEQLKQGVGQRIGTADPGKPGNMVLSAHNDIFGQIFRQLDQLEVGDEIIIYTNVRSYTYIIDQEFLIVEPTDVHVLDATADPTLTLISCYPYLIDNKRIIVKASLVE